MAALSLPASKNGHANGHARIVGDEEKERPSERQNTVDPSEESLDRARYAKRLLAGILNDKLGNLAAYGETSIRLRWQGGQLQLVNVTDSADYK